jgi:uncharacterized protein (DUF1697 family)
MQRYIAFLRAINVGGHTVKMEQLRGLFADLGFANVETFIASGNVIFEAEGAKPEALEKQIEAHLRQAFGYAVATFIRTPAELAAVASYQPFPPSELEAAGSSLYVGFLPKPPTDEAQRKLLALGNGIDDFHIHQRELYWLARQGMGRSTISGAQLEKALGLPGTLRNITTVRKLATKYPAPS